jgi:hypothetical protein
MNLELPTGAAPAGIDIVMPTYNCEPWLDAFMESLLAQDFADWRLIARDDRSADGTARRLAEWQSRLGGRMSILPDSGTRNLGVCGNYTAVLAATRTARVMCADPDDLWLPGKINSTLRAMDDAEKSFTAAVPLAICTDARVVDGSGRTDAPSYWRWSRMAPHLAKDPVRVAMESVALGSTMMVNRALLDLALPIPDGAPYQDWWLALVAAAFGRLIPLAEPTILYRRHGTNATHDPYSSGLLGAVRRTLQSPAAPGARLAKVLGQAAAQAALFVERYRQSLPGNQRAALEALAALPSRGPVARRLGVLRHGLWFGSPLKNAAMLALV